MLILNQFYDNICRKNYLRTDGRTDQNYSSEPHLTQNLMSIVNNVICEVPFYK